MKIDTKFIIKEYDNKLIDYENLAKDVDFKLRKLINNSKIKIHSVSHRIKGIDSILDKIRRNKLANPFEEIHDFVGFRVVCLFLSDLNEIRNSIDKEFYIIDEDDKVHDAELEMFGYMSLHIKAKLKPPQSVLINSIENSPFEIQIRTIAQDAWASISHHLDYKNDNTFSKEIERDFHALSGLFYVADTHFSLIKDNQLKQYFESKK